MVRHVVMALDVIEVDGLAETALLKQIARVGPKMRVVDDSPQVALEVAEVDAVETHERGEETDVRLGQLAVHEVPLRREAGLHPVEPLEERIDGCLVRLLRGREPGLVDAVIDADYYSKRVSRPIKRGYR